MTINNEFLSNFISNSDTPQYVTAQLSSPIPSQSTTPQSSSPVSSQSDQSDQSLSRSQRKNNVFLDQATMDRCVQMAKSGRTPKEIKEWSGQSLRSAQRIVQQVFPVGMPIAQDERGEINANTITVKKRGRKAKDFSNLKSKIENVIRNDPSLTRRGIFIFHFSLGIIDLLPAPYDSSSEKLIGDMLKEMNYTRKRLRSIPKTRNDEANVNTRFQYCHMISRVADEDLFFLDETGFNLHVNPTYGWAPANQNAVITVPNNRGRNLSVIAVACNAGMVSYELMHGSYNTDLLYTFLNEVFYPRIPEDRLGNLLIYLGNVVLVMDNARFHHSQIVRNWAAEKGIRLEYLPPYSPHLNPIEEIFALVKATYRGVRPRPQSIDEMVAAINETLGNLVSNDFSNYWRHMREFVETGKNRMPFI